MIIKNIYKQIENVPNSNEYITVVHYALFIRKKI
jgi:hypothetical protein